LDGWAGSGGAKSTDHCRSAKLLSMANEGATSLVHGSENLESLNFPVIIKARAHVTRQVSRDVLGFFGARRSRGKQEEAENGSSQPNSDTSSPFLSLSPTWVPAVSCVSQGTHRE
jgi:hypothetical protein